MTRNLIVSRPKGGGKTTELIRRCAEVGGYIITPDRKRAEYIMCLAESLGIDYLRYPITFKEFLAGRFHAPGMRAFFIDDLDECLRPFARGVSILGLSVTTLEE